MPPAWSYCTIQVPLAAIIVKVSPLLVQTPVLPLL
jgi:hypothetical protein